MLTDQFLAIAERTPPTRYQALERLIECWATPIEFVCLPRLLAGRSLQAFADHLAGGALYRSIVDSAEIRNFERNDLGQDVTLYVSNDTRRPSAGRHLLVGFAASGGRLTLPIAGFLQSICALGGVYIQDSQSKEILIQAAGWMEVSMDGSTGT